MPSTLIRARDGALISQEKDLAAGHKTTPTCLELFWHLALVGLCGFGGVLPWARRRMVDHCAWLTEREFTELLALGQLMPGPNIANVVVIYGRRQHGALGALSAVTGLYICPTIVTIALGLLYAHWGQLADIKQVFGAVMPIAAGLTLGTALRLGKSLPRSIHTLAFALFTFVTMGLLIWPLWVVLLLGAPLSVVLTRRHLLREGAPRS